MLKRLALAALILLGLGGEALSWPIHGVNTGGGGGSSPIVLPGATQPTPASGTNGPILTFSPGYNTITPTQHGSSGDYGYGVKGSIRWDGYQFLNITSTTQVGLFAWHTGTAAQIAAGQATNIDHVDVRCDNGSWYTITGPTVNANAGGVTDWNFTVNPANFANGVHKCDARAVPTTGPDIIAEGPASDAYGNRYETVKSKLTKIDNGGSTWGVAGNVLTLFDTNPAGNGAMLNFNSNSLGSANVISVGMSVSAIGAGANTFIDGTHTAGNTDCGGGAGSCTGTGQFGTYHLSQAGLSAQAVFTATISGTTMTVTSLSSGYISVGGADMAGPGVTAGTQVLTQSSGTAGGVGVYTINTSQTVASSTVMYELTGATYGTMRSFYFTTGVTRPTAYVSLSGNDTTGTGTATSPFLTIGKAETYVNANGVTAGGWAGAYGGTVCLENGSSYLWADPGSHTSPGSAYGYLEFRSALAGDSLCPHTSDPGGATVTNDNSSRAYWPMHSKFSYLNFKGPATDLSGGDAWFLVADHVAEKHDLEDLGGVLGSGGYYCLEITSWFGTDGGCSGAVMVRGSSLKYSNSDGAHDVPVFVNNTVDGNGNALEWMTGQFNSATPTVVTNVQILPAELSGYKISDIVSTGNAAWSLARTDRAENDPAWNCFGTGRSNSISSIDDVNRTITFSGVTSSGTCANGYTGYLYYSGNHPDLYQVQITSQHSDVYISGNNFNTTYQSFTQGLFIETMGIASIYVGHNNFYTDPAGVENMFPTDGNGEAFVTDSNYFHGVSSYNFDAYIGSAQETLVNDTCFAGGFVGKASAQHRKAAASSACYTTLP